MRHVSPPEMVAVRGVQWQAGVLAREEDRLAVQPPNKVPLHLRYRPEARVIRTETRPD